MSAALQANFVIQPVRRIGEGGFGVVDEVVVSASNDPRHPVGMRLARKQLGPQWANHPEILARFEREIAQLRAMQHPNIVRIEGENLGGGQRFYLMPLYAGTLRQQVGGKTHAPHVVASFGRKIASALTHAHDLGFLHRDLKPENILLDGMTPIVSDWGLGRHVHKQSKVLTRGGLGTEWYCPPEQWNGLETDGRADVYALGVVLGEMLLGRMPLQFPGVGIQSRLVPAVPALSDLLQKMTMVRIGARPAMHVVLGELTAVNPF